MLGNMLLKLFIVARIQSI